MSRAKQHYLDGLADGFDAAITHIMKFNDAIYDTSMIYSQGLENREEQRKLKFAMSTLEALREQLEDVEVTNLDRAAPTSGEIELTDMTEDDWNEIQDAGVFQKALVTLIARYKSEGYVAATLDKFAGLVVGGHAAWNEDEE